MKNTHKLSLKIISLFTIAILSTFVGDYLHSFLGDWQCLGSGYINNKFHYERCNYAGSLFHDPRWHWGYRHWLYFSMCLCLFVIQAKDIITPNEINT